jgi:hypothetical protein
MLQEAEVKDGLYYFVLLEFQVEPPDIGVARRGSAMVS